MEHIAERFIFRLSVSRSTQMPFKPLVTNATYSGQMDDLDPTQFHDHELIELITRCPLLINTVPDPSDELKMIAVRNDGFALDCIKNPDVAMQLAAVQNDGRAIVFIRKRTPEIEAAAVNQNGLVIKYIKNPSYDLKLAAVMENPDAIYLISDPDDELKAIAELNRME